MAARLFIAGTLAVSGVLAATPNVLAIGHWYSSDPEINDRYYSSPNYDGSIPPADLVAPTDYLMTGKGAFVAPLWIMGAHHQSGDIDTGDTVFVHIPKSLLSIGGSGYEVVEIDVDYGISPTGAASGQPTDIRLIKLEDEVIPYSGGQTLSEFNQHYLRLSPWLFDGSEVTFGGFGDIFTGDPDGTPVGDKGLHWGQNVVSNVGSSDVGKNLSFTLDQPGTGDYRKYEGAPLGSDSGSGIFFRDGWEWAIGGTLVSGPPQGMGFETTPVTVHGLDLRSNYDWVIETLDTDLPAYYSPPLPERNRIWNAQYSDNWSDTNSWTGGLPSETSVVDIFRSINIDNSTGIASAKDVFLRSDGGFVGQVNQSGGDLYVSSIFVGPESDDSNIYLLSGGNVYAESVYAGVYGCGIIGQLGGELVATEAIFVGKDNGGAVGIGTGYYMTAGLLSTPRLILGADIDSDGVLSLATGMPHADADLIYVGDRGTGEVIQSAGSISTEWLVLGVFEGATGFYDLSGGTLTVSVGGTIVGDGGEGAFEQLGGTHTTPLLSVSESSAYELSGGTLSADEINTEGDMLVTGGLLESRTINGTVDLDDSAATVRGKSGLSDFSDATFANASSSTLVVQEDSLILLGAASPFLQITGNGSLAPHVVGNQLDIGEAGFVGYGEIPDFVEMTDGGYIGVPDGQTLGLNEGIVIESGVASISTGSGQVSVLSSITASGIEVDVDATLEMSGNIYLNDAGASLTVEGELQISDRIDPDDPSRLVLLGINQENTILSFSDSSQLSLRIEEATHSSPEFGYDNIVLAYGIAQLDGTLDLELLNDFEPSPRDTFQIVWTGAYAEIEGTFAEVTANGGSIVVLDPMDEQIALAVLYDSEEVLVRASLPGDFNLDDLVDTADVLIFNQNYNMFPNGGATWINGDTNGDGLVDTADYLILGQNLWRSWSSEAQIPEPSTLALTTLALLALLAHARRRK